MGSRGRGREGGGGGGGGGGDLPMDCKVYCGGLPSDTTSHELEDVFGRYGRLRKVWVARRPPGFAFIEFEDQRDAEDSVKALDGTRICGVRARVEMSSGRRRGGGGGRGGGRGGGFRDDDRGGDRYRARSRSPRGGGGRSRSRSPRRSPPSEARRSFSRSPKRAAGSRSVSRSVSPPRRD